MSESRIEIKIGQITFSGEGQPDWLSKQLDKILAQAEKLVQLVPAAPEAANGDTGKAPPSASSAVSKKTLPAFLQEKGATTNQTKKFLATAAWLQARGQNRVQSKDVAKALKDSNQTRLGNPADCLNKNVSKGYCEKDGNQFFVTDDGLKSLS